MQYDNEISLVDIATIFLRRRRIFYTVFVAVILAGVGYAIFVPEEYGYVSLVKLAEKGSGEYVQEPTTVIAQLENYWLPESQAAYRAEHDRKLPFEVTFSNPENTGLIRMSTEATPSEVEVVKRIHGQLIETLKQKQSTAMSLLTQGLEKQLESLDSTIEMLQGTPESGAAIASAIERRVSVEAKLASVEPMETLVISRESAEKKGLAKSLIVLLAGLLGLLAGILMAFFTEFACLVKENLAEI